MQDQPKSRDVQEVFAQLDQNWQELVKVIKEGRGQPSAPTGPDQGVVPQEAVRGIKEDRSPSMPDNGRQVGPAIPEALEPGQPEAEMPPPSPALEPPSEKLPPKSWGQKFFNVAILALLVATSGGLFFLLAQTQWGGGKVETGMLTICGKDGVRRAYLGERDGQISLGLLDKAGRTRVDVSLDAAGSPSMCLIDELQQNRVELKMGPGGEPVLRQVKQVPWEPVGHESKAPTAPGNESTAPKVAATDTAASKAPKTEAALPENPDHNKPATVAPAGEAAKQGAGPGSVLAEATGSNAPSPVPTVKLVGSKTSNKYHYPDCKWAKQIRPEKMVTFSSAEEAREKGYVPCPTCKAPKLTSPPGN